MDKKKEYNLRTKNEKIILDADFDDMT